MVDLTPLWLSLKVSVVATIAIFPGGILLAWWLAHGKNFPGRSVLETLFSLPLVLPPTVVGFYLLSLLGRGTACGRWLNDVIGIKLIFTWQGAAVAAGVMGFPLLVRTATSAFATINEDLLEVGRTLGAGELTLLSRVILPLSYRGISCGSDSCVSKGAGRVWCHPHDRRFDTRADPNFASGTL